MSYFLLSPYYKIQKNGLSDYSYLFACHLRENLEENGQRNIRKTNKDVRIITRTGYNGDDLFFDFENWNLLTGLKLLFSLAFKPLSVSPINDHTNNLIIQFVPHMYNPKGGIAPSLALFTLFVRLLTPIRISTIFHELHYPFSWQLKAIVMWCCHHFMFLLCMWSSHDCFFSTQAFLKKGQSLSFHERNFWLPVGSNIPRRRSERGRQLSLSYFGSLHSSRRFDVIAEALKGLDIPFSLSIIGKGEEGGHYHYYKDDERFIFLGELPEEEVALILARSHYLISYFSDGVSSRRGSILAALNQGTPCISTEGWGTDPLFYEFPGVFLCDSDPAAFKAQLKDILMKVSYQEIDGDYIRRFYDETFDWQVIIKQFLTRLDS